MKIGDRFRFLNHPSYPVTEEFTVNRSSKNYLDCETSRFPGVTHTFPLYRETFKRYEVVTDADMMMAAANAVANTPIGEYIDFSRTAQELGKAA